MSGDDPRLGLTPKMRDAVFGRCVACRAWTEVSPRTGECETCHARRLDAGVRPLLRDLLPDRALTRRRLAGHAILAVVAAWASLSTWAILGMAGAADHAALLGVPGFALIALAVFTFGEMLTLSQRLLIGGSA